MSSKKNNENNPSRRDFFQDLTAGAAGAAIAGALTQLNAPAAVAAAAQQSKMPAMPPWPKGTTGNKYDHLICTRFKEKSTIPEVQNPQTYFRGESELPGAGINMGWQVFTKPIKLELQSHRHDVDEYLFFLGAELPDLVSSFDGEIEIFLGNEYERHIITKASIIYVPRGMEHNPMEIRRLGKPMMLTALLLAPYFNGFYQASKYMELRSVPTIE